MSAFPVNLPPAVVFSFKCLLITACSGETGGCSSEKLRRVNLPGCYQLWEWRARGFQEAQEQVQDGNVMKAERQKKNNKKKKTTLSVGHGLQLFLLSENVGVLI